MDQIPEELLQRAVTGVNLVPGQLKDQLGEGPTLLVFLRFFGCIFCREAVSDLRAAAEADPDYPAVLFFSQGSSTETRAFLRRYWPGARVVVDPKLEWYDAMGVGRASFLQTFGPAVVAAGLRARARGHEYGERSGDVWRLPGVFVAKGRRIVWSHTPRNGADQPDFAAIPGQLNARAKA